MPLFIFVESGSGLIWQLLLTLLAMLPVHLLIATKLMGVGFALLAIAKLNQIS